VAVEFTFLFAAGNYRTIAIKVYPRAKPMLTANITQSHCNRCSTWRMNTVYNMNYEWLDPFVLPANLNQQSRGARLLELFTFLTQKLSFFGGSFIKSPLCKPAPQSALLFGRKKNANHTEKSPFNSPGCCCWSNFN